MSSSGKKYYYNCRTEVSQWEKPTDWLQWEHRQNNSSSSKSSHSSYNNSSVRGNSYSNSSSKSYNSNNSSSKSSNYNSSCDPSNYSSKNCLYGGSVNKSHNNSINSNHNNSIKDKNYDRNKNGEYMYLLFYIQFYIFMYCMINEVMETSLTIPVDCNWKRLLLNICNHVLITIHKVVLKNNSDLKTFLIQLLESPSHFEKYRFLCFFL